MIYRRKHENQIAVKSESARAALQEHKGRAAEHRGSVRILTPGRVVGIPWGPRSPAHWLQVQGMVLHEVLTVRVFIWRGFTLCACPCVAGWEWSLLAAGAAVPPEPRPVPQGAQLAQYLQTVCEGLWRPGSLTWCLCLWPSQRTRGIGCVQLWGW